MLIESICLAGHQGIPEVQCNPQVHGVQLVSVFRSRHVSYFNLSLVTHMRVLCSSKSSQPVH